MSKFCGKCGSLLTKNGSCPKCDAAFVSHDSSKNGKKRVCAILVIVFLCIVIVGALYAKHEGLIGKSFHQNFQTPEDQSQAFSKAMVDGKIDKKEFKKLVKDGTVRREIDNEAIIEWLCNIIEKYNKPIEDNYLTREEAEEKINNILGKEVNFEWSSSSRPLFLFVDSNRYIFMEYFESEPFSIKHYRIIDQNNNCLYLIIDEEQCFRYVKSDLNFSYDETKDISGYSSAVVLKSTRKMLCGFEWYYLPNKNYIHTIYDGDGNAQVYALYPQNDERFYYDSALKEVSNDYYSSIMNNYMESIKETYNFDIGYYGI